MSHFAAGCAVCGYDLEAARARQAAKRRIELPSNPFSLDSDWVQVGIALILVVAFPALSLVLSIYWASKRYNSGETALAIALLVVAAVAVFALANPFWFWSHIY